jgi:hypothetical protein
MCRRPRQPADAAVVERRKGSQRCSISRKPRECVRLAVRKRLHHCGTRGTDARIPRGGEPAPPNSNDPSRPCLPAGVHVAAARMVNTPPVAGSALSRDGRESAEALLPGHTLSWSDSVAGFIPVAAPRAYNRDP